MHQFLAKEGIKVDKAVKSAAVLAAEARRDELMKDMLEGSETKSARRRLRAQAVAPDSKSDRAAAQEQALPSPFSS